MFFSVTSSGAKLLRERGAYIRYGTVAARFERADDFRYSVVVSKKQGNAVARNRVKRRIRAMLGSLPHPRPDGHFLIYYRGDCSAFNHDRVANDLEHILSESEKHAAHDDTARRIR